MVSKILIPEAIGASQQRVGGMTALSYMDQDFIYSVDILLASNFLFSKQQQYPCQFPEQKSEVYTSP